MKRRNLLLSFILLAFLSFLNLDWTRAYAHSLSAAEPPQESLAKAAASPSPSPASSPIASVDTATNNPPKVADVATAKPDTIDPAGKTTNKVGKVTLPADKAAAVRIVRFETPPVIDGKLDEPVWKQAAVLKDFYQIDPGDNTPPSKATDVLLGYDAKTLYIAFRAYDEPDKVRATVPRRDQIFNDDYVGFFMDTFNDQRRAYCVFFSPLGVQADGIMTEGRGEDYSVDIVMDSKGQVTSDGFIVEVAIPFKSLRYEAGKGKHWGAHFFRRIKRLNNELSSWMPISREVRGTMNQSGQLSGLEGISTERTLEVIPSLTLSQTGKRFRAFSPVPGAIDDGRLVNQPLAFDPGLTAKFGLTPQVTLDLAINPDFAQVEADQLVSVANQRFPIFFSERRPFFLEGIDIFQTRMNVVHTRAIIDPDVAFKVSGKRGKNTFGLMLASDNGPGNFIGDERLSSSNQPFLDKNAYVGVLRLKRDIGKENSLGIIATSYSFIQKHNNALGFDGRFKPSPKVIAEFQVVGTTSRGHFFNPERDACFDLSTQKSVPSTVSGCSEYRNGNALGYNYVSNYGGRNLFVEVYGNGRTRDFRTDVGFVQRTNANVNGFFVGWFSDPKQKAKLASWNVRTFHNLGNDFQGRSQFWESDYRFTLNFQKQSWFELGYRRGYERLFEEEFGRTRSATRQGRFFGDEERATDKNGVYVNGGTTLNKKYQFNAFASYRTGIFDLDFGGGRKFPRVSPGSLINPGQLDPGAGAQFEVGGTLNWQPTNAIRSTLNLTKIRLTRDDTGGIAFDETLLSSRTTYQFTKYIFTRARFDYSTRSTNLRTQMLFGWTPSPGTALYAGYNDDMFYGFNPISRLLDPGFTRRERSFFIKMSYLFRKSFG